MSGLEEKFSKACKDGDVNTVKECLEAGVDVNIQSKFDATALVYTSSKGYIEIARLLIKQGAGVDIQNKAGWTALMFAIFKGHIGIVKLLIEHNANVNIQGKNGRTAFMIQTSYYEQEKTIELLIDSDADVTIKDKNGKTALDFAKGNNHKKTINLLEYVQNIQRLAKTVSKLDNYEFSI